MFSGFIIGVLGFIFLIVMYEREEKADTIDKVGSYVGLFIIALGALVMAANALNICR